MEALTTRCSMLVLLKRRLTAAVSVQCLSLVNCGITFRSLQHWRKAKVQRSQAFCLPCRCATAQEPVFSARAQLLHVSGIFEKVSACRAHFSIFLLGFKIIRGGPSLASVFWLKLDRRQPRRGISHLRCASFGTSSPVRSTWFSHLIFSQTI